MGTKLSQLGALFVTIILLQRSKKGKEGAESVGEKLNRHNFRTRVDVVRNAVNHSPNSQRAAQEIRHSFFTDVDESTLAGYLDELVANPELISTQMEPIPAEAMTVAITAVQTDTVDEVEEDDDDFSEEQEEPDYEPSEVG